MSLLPMPEALARRSTLHLPQGDWATVLDCLCAHFPAISREVWLDRMARGRVLVLAHVKELVAQNHAKYCALGDRKSVV